MKTIKLGENSYERLKSTLINEISVGLVDNANRVSDKIFWHLKSAFDSFYSELEDTMFNLRWNMEDNQMKSNPYISKIKEYADVIQEILDKKDGSNDKNWLDIVKDYDLDCSSEALRKLSAGIKFAYASGMRFDMDDLVHIDRTFVERQKLYDVQRKYRQDMREFSRTELICERIDQAIKNLPKIVVQNKITEKSKLAKKDLVLGIGDFHYGAEFKVTGLYGETLNEYNSEVFERRMETLSNEIKAIVKKEKPEQLTIMIAGDMLDGLLRTSQLQRLEFGVVESAINLGEYLTYWLITLENKTNIPIRVYGVRGNHGEIRPL